MTVRTVGIVGCGVIGGALKVWIEKNLGWLSILFFILLIGSFFLIKLS